MNPDENGSINFFKRKGMKKEGITTKHVTYNDDMTRLSLLLFLSLLKYFSVRDSLRVTIMRRNEIVFVKFGQLGSVLNDK